MNTKSRPRIKKVLGLFAKKNYITVTVKQIEANKLLVNRRIIVTGGGRGLGFYIAQRCIAEGADVLIAGRNEKVLKEKDEINKAFEGRWRMKGDSTLTTLLEAVEVEFN